MQPAVCALLAGAWLIAAWQRRQFVGTLRAGRTPAPSESLCVPCTSRGKVLGRQTHSPALLVKRLKVEDHSSKWNLHAVICQLEAAGWLSKARFSLSTLTPGSPPIRRNVCSVPASIPFLPTPS